MCTDTIIICAATILGPIVAVALTLWRQGKFEAAQRSFQQDLLSRLEAQRAEFERQLHKEREEFEIRWNRADLNRHDEMNSNLKHIVLALKPDYKFPSR